MRCPSGRAGMSIGMQQTRPAALWRACEKMHSSSRRWSAPPAQKTDIVMDGEPLVWSGPFDGGSMRTLLYLRARARAARDQLARRAPARAARTAPSPSARYRRRVQRRHPHRQPIGHGCGLRQCGSFPSMLGRLGSGPWWTACCACAAFERRAHGRSQRIARGARGARGTCRADRMCHGPRALGRRGSGRHGRLRKPARVAAAARPLEQGARRAVEAGSAACRSRSPRWPGVALLTSRRRRGQCF